MAASKTCGYRTFVFNFFWQTIFFSLTVAAFIKCGSILPKVVFYRCGFKFGLNLRVENMALNLV